MSGTIFLTGANAGIGLATTALFLSKGWNVAGTARNPSTATELKELEQKYPNNLLIVKLDLLAQETIQSAVDESIAKFGRVDILINNAGFGQYGPVEVVSMDEVKDQFETNVYGPIRTIKAFLPHFHTAKSRRPQILNISSGAGHFALPLGSLYHASKGALELLSEAMMYELAALSTPITLKLIVPFGGVAQTNFFGSLMAMGPAIQEAPALEAQVKQDYAAFVDKQMQTFMKMAGQSMGASEVADKIFEASTDGNNDKLRYFVGPESGGIALHLRFAGAKFEGESPGSIDERYMSALKKTFA